MWICLTGGKEEGWFWKNSESRQNPMKKHKETKYIRNIKVFFSLLFGILLKYTSTSKNLQKLIKYPFGARKVKSFLKDFHETCEKFICLWKELLLLCQSLNWSFIWQNPSLQHDIKSALEFRMSHLGGFHSKVAMRFFSWQNAF